MRAHCLMHVPFEGPGKIAEWLEEHGYELTFTKFYKNDDVPEVSEIDFLVIMGGPMSVNDERDYPWLISEKAFISRVMATHIPVIGICLGAQLLAAAAGSRVFANEYKEIGWFPVEGLETDVSGVFSFPESFTTFHWHGETFDLPDGAVPLADSAGCPLQAFQIGRRVMGLQFHPEMTHDSLASIVEHCRDELVGGRYIQNEEAVLHPVPGVQDANYRLLDKILAFLTSDG